jgi:hypothetical protein
MSGVLPRFSQYAFMALAGTALRHDPHARTDTCRYSLTIRRVNKLRQHSSISTVKGRSEFLILCVCVCVCVCVWTDEQIIQEAGWAPGPVWTDAENLAPTGIRSPDRPAVAKPTELSRPPHLCRLRQINYLFCLCA